MTDTTTTERRAGREPLLTVGRPSAEWTSRPGEGAENLVREPPRPVLGPVLAALALAAVAVALALVDPSRGPVLCPFRALTGLACPGCGATRGLHALLTGDLGAALRYNALTVALLPFALWAAYVSLGHALGGPRLKVLRLSPLGTWAFAAVVAAWWVVRNLPMVPFSGLAPPT